MKRLDEGSTPRRLVRDFEAGFSLTRSPRSPRSTLIFPRSDDGPEDGGARREKSKSSDDAMRRDRERGGGGAPEGSRRRGDEAFRTILHYVALAGAGWAGVERLTYAELVQLGEAKRVEEWERAAFVATYAYNANPFLRRPVNVSNPFMVQKEQEVERVRFEDVFPEVAESNENVGQGVQRWDGETAHDSY